MSKITHVYWFAPYNLTCPSTRYRGKMPLEYAQEKHNITFDFVTPSRSLKGLYAFAKIYFKILFFRKKNALIVIQKICSNRLYANALKLLVLLKNKQTLYDLDDAEYLRQDTKSLHFFLQHCEKIQVGSLALKNYCLQFNPNVYIATSPVYRHTSKKVSKNKKIHIGWVGDVGDGNNISQNFSHKTSLFHILFPQILQIKHPLKLSIIGVKKASDVPQIVRFFEQSKNIELDIPLNLNWEDDAWLYPKICQFDIGLSPLVKHPFNIAKSAFKAKQYLSCGVLTIASNVGENSRYVKHGYNGFIADQPSDFVDFIHQVATMSQAEYRVYLENAFNSYENFSMHNYCLLLLQKKRDT
ncbi:hypothetical protein [Aureispira sp. CCB-E]|uniref:hypothetical protein n=1 Tax=Aureispira sp. CCB-E TaxID=3051121 RepID=UPI00286868DD|nr:hypothetical protein [Aureispira sp. CCB-E]WMX13483.1 hypothetical protein QP953_21785 [Aureispira sp. CCB-E]